MTIDITADGAVVCLYTEVIDLHAIGPLKITRASNVEYDSALCAWVVRLDHDPAATPLFQNPSRGVCLAWEHENDHVLIEESQKWRDPKDGRDR